MKYRDTEAFKELDGAIHDWALEHRDMVKNLGRFSVDAATFAYEQLLDIEIDGEVYEEAADAMLDARNEQSPA